MAHSFQRHLYKAIIEFIRWVPSSRRTVLLDFYEALSNSPLHQLSRRAACGSWMLYTVYHAEPGKTTVP